MSTQHEIKGEKDSHVEETAAYLTSEMEERNMQVSQLIEPMLEPMLRTGPPMHQGSLVFALTFANPLEETLKCSMRGFLGVGCA